MTFGNLHFARQIRCCEDDARPTQSSVPLVPALIGTLAAANVASVVLALME